MARRRAWMLLVACSLSCWLPGQAGMLRLPRPALEGRAPRKGASVHTVITTECTTYFDWQSLGLLYRQGPLLLPSSFTACIRASPRRAPVLSLRPWASHACSIKCLSAAPLCLSISC
jgi:hypothetical protein